MGKAKLVRKGLARDSAEIVTWQQEVLQGGLGNLSIASQFTTHIFAHYLAGLRTAGWAGDPNGVRLGFTAAAAMKYCFPYMLRHMFSEEGQAWLAQVQKQQDHDPFANMSAKRSFIFTLAAEARQLLNEL